MPAGESKAQVLIELQLEMKKLKSQLKSVTKEFKNFKKEIEAISEAQADSSKEQIDDLKKLESAQKKTTQEAVRAAKQQAKATKQATDEIKNQEKELGRLGKVMNKIKESGVGRFAGGFAAGSGLAGLGKGMGSLRGLGGTAGRLVSRAAGGILGFATSGITSAYQTYMQYGAAQAGLAGLGRPGQLRGGLRAAGGVGGAGLGYGPTETVQQARGIGRATGNIGAVYRAQQFARGYGLDVGEAGGYMGMIRQAGYGFGGEVRGEGGRMAATQRQGSRELTKVIEAGMISGLEKGRIGEFLQGVSSITSQLGSQLPGKINVSGIAAQAAMLGQSKLPGFQGARGMQLLGRLNQAIQRPGGGEAGQAMMLQALGFGKPGGGTRYYEALKMQEEGIQDPRNIPKLFKEVYSQLGDPAKGGRSMVNEEANLAMKEMTGLSLKQVEELQNIMASGEDAKKQQEKIEELMKKAEPIEKQALKVSKQGFLGVAKHMAGVEAKQIAIGATFAPIFMKIQNAQLEALKWMADHFPKVENWLKEIYSDIRGIFRATLESLGLKDYRQVQQRIDEHTFAMQKAGVLEEAKTFQERSQMYKKRSAIRQKTLERLASQRYGEESGMGEIGFMNIISNFAGERIRRQHMNIAYGAASGGVKQQQKREREQFEKLRKHMKIGRKMFPGDEQKAYEYAAGQVGMSVGRGKLTAKESLERVQKTEPAESFAEKMNRKARLLQEQKGKRADPDDVSGPNRKGKKSNLVARTNRP